MNRDVPAYKLAMCTSEKVVKKPPAYDISIMLRDEKTTLD